MKNLKLKLAKITFEAIFGLSIGAISILMVAQGLMGGSALAQSAPTVERIYSNYFLNIYEYDQTGYVVGRNLTDMAGYNPALGFNIGTQINNQFKSFTEGATLETTPPSYISLPNTSYQVIKFVVPANTDMSLKLGVSRFQLFDHISVQPASATTPNPNPVYISTATNTNDDDLGVVEKINFDADRSDIYLDGNIRGQKVLYGAEDLGKGTLHNNSSYVNVDIDYFNTETGSMIPIARDFRCYGSCLQSPVLWSRNAMPVETIGANSGQIRMFLKGYSKEMGPYYVSDNHDADQNDTEELFSVLQMEIRNQTTDDSANWNNGDSWYKDTTKKIAIDVADSVNLPAKVNVLAIGAGSGGPFSIPQFILLGRDVPVVHGRNQFTWTVGKDWQGNNANFDPTKEYTITAGFSSTLVINRGGSDANPNHLFIRTAVTGSVSSPTQAANVYWGDTVPVTFTLSGDQLPARVKIELSNNDGTTWRTLTDDFAITGAGPFTYNWTPVPTNRSLDRNTNAARIRITSTDAALPFNITSNAFAIGPHAGIDLDWNTTLGRQGLIFVPTVINPTTKSVRVYALLDAITAEGVTLPTYDTEILVQAGFDKADGDRYIKIPHAGFNGLVNLGEFDYDGTYNTFVAKLVADPNNWWESAPAQATDNNNILQVSLDTTKFGVKLDLTTSAVGPLVIGVPGHDSFTLTSTISPRGDYAEAMEDIELTLLYDAAKLDWVSTSFTPPQFYDFTVTEPTPGTLHIVLNRLASPLPSKNALVLPALTFKGVAAGSADIRIKWDGENAGSPSDDTNIWEHILIGDNPGDPAILDEIVDLLGQVTPTTLTTTVRVADGTEVGNTPVYKTRLFDVRYRDGQVLDATLQSLGVFTATGESVMTDVSTIDYAVKFYDASKQVIYPDNRTGFDTDGFFAVTSGVDLNTVLSGSWLTSVIYMQFRVQMTTLDYDIHTPKVKALAVGIQLNEVLPGSTIGTINFTANPPYTFVINPGATTDIPVRVSSALVSGSTPVTVQLAMDWDSIQAPTGVTATFLQNGIADSTIENFGPGTITNLTLRLATTAQTPDGNYIFQVAGTVTGSSDALTPTPQANLQINSASDFFINFAAPTDRTVVVGGIQLFPFTIVRDASFDKNIILSTDIIDAAKFGNDVASAKFLKGETEVTQITPADFTNNVIDLVLKVTAATTDIDKINIPVSFKIAGTYTDGTINGHKVESTNTGVLTMTTIAGDRLISLTINAPLQANSSRNGITFRVRFYNLTLVPFGLDPANDRTALSYDSATASTITLTNIKVKTGDKYAAFVRSTRHAWKKSEEITIGTPTSYTLTVAPLMAGDLAGNDTCRNLQPDNKITTTDLVSFWPDYGKTGDSLPFDINGDGKVNFADGQFILNQLTKSGDTLPSVGNCS